MALNKVRVQLLSTTTGEVLQEVDVLTSADSVLFSDGQTFQQKLDAGTLKGATGAQGAQGVQGVQGVQGEAFSISKIYASVALMNTGYATDGLAQGKFVLVNTGNVEDADNAKLYVKGATAYSFVTDLSGAKGIQGIQGVQGVQGAKGDKGAKGDTGATGAKGATGATGATGAAGTRGSLWYAGTSITGTSTTATVFSGSGVTSALPGDIYHNTSTNNIYTCVVGGAASVATWKYVTNIKGATGAQGIQGIQGKQGVSGETVKIGTTYATATQANLFFKLS